MSDGALGRALERTPEPPEGDVHSARPLKRATSIDCGAQFCQSFWTGRPRGPNARQLELSLRLQTPPVSRIEYAQRDLCDDDKDDGPPTALGWEREVRIGNAPRLPARLPPGSLFGNAPCPCSGPPTTEAPSPLFVRAARSS